MHRYQDFEKLLQRQPTEIRKAVQMLHDENKELALKLTQLMQFYAAMHDSVNSLIDYLAAQTPEARKNALMQGLGQAEGAQPTKLKLAIDNAVKENRGGIEVGPAADDNEPTDAA